MSAIKTLIDTGWIDGTLENNDPSKKVLFRWTEEKSVLSLLNRNEKTKGSPYMRILHELREVCWWAMLGSQYIILSRKVQAKHYSQNFQNFIRIITKRKNIPLLSELSKHLLFISIPQNPICAMKLQLLIPCVK